METLNLGRFDVLLSLDTLQSPTMKPKPLFQQLFQNHLHPGGRVLLSLPNCRYRDGQIEYGARTKNFQRAELSLAYSDDDGKSWTAPVVIARRSGGGLSYPYLFETNPGELWVFTRFSFQVKLRVRESDFVQP